MAGSSRSGCPRCQDAPDAQIHDRRTAPSPAQREQTRARASFHKLDATFMCRNSQCGRKEIQSLKMHFVAFLFTKATEMSLHAVTNDSRPPPGRVGPLHPSSHGTSSGGLLHPSSGEVGTGGGGPAAPQLMGSAQEPSEPQWPQLS